VLAIIAVARALNRIIAEGVENAADDAFLKNGVDERQGYLLCAPDARRRT
jgi:EAL domain-containing protein (putative c-di-GMP-specific phosphodiesterase class I)